MRKLASIKKIEEVKPIRDAILICAYRVDGWWVVDQIEKYQPGDLAVYCEIDSWIPHDLAPFLSKGQEPREFNGIRGERLRTVKLRGITSQGLLLSLRDPIVYQALLGSNDWYEGQDVSEMLGIVKYEPPIPAQLAGEVKGPFPGYISKTDQERIQNLSLEFAQWQFEEARWEVTEKLDGCSMTAYVRDNEFGVCSRNLELRRNETNSLWRAAVAQNLEEIVRSTGRNLALQGELVGEGIQGNLYRLKGQKFYLYDIFDIDAGRYLLPEERDAFEVIRVPLLATECLLLPTVEEILQWAEGKSELNPTADREGVVFKRYGSNASFKAISNRFLLKEK
jgi:RNA ligase (TIGR02306 family)